MYILVSWLRRNNSRPRFYNKRKTLNSQDKLLKRWCLSSIFFTFAWSITWPTDNNETKLWLFCTYTSVLLKCIDALKWVSNSHHLNRDLVEALIEFPFDELWSPAVIQRSAQRWWRVPKPDRMIPPSAAFRVMTSCESFWPLRPTEAPSTDLVLRVRVPETSQIVCFVFAQCILLSYKAMCSEEKFVHQTQNDLA